MLMPKLNRKKIYEHLFEEGVCVAKKDFNLKSHPEIKEVSNLEVIKACKSLASRELVKEQFAWRYYYFYLTDEGIKYLRDYLGLTEDVIPATHKVMRAERPVFGAKSAAGGPKGEGERSGYRAATEKATEAGPGAAPVRHGFGRGEPQHQ
uniref:S10_plectin domain-containing protein n=1 Tax=Steinernema glaseri TaxID=37863 RepID=A0A1I8A5V4_9BILA